MTDELHFANGGSQRARGFLAGFLLEDARPGDDAVRALADLLLAGIEAAGMSEVRHIMGPKETGQSQLVRNSLQ